MQRHDNLFHLPHDLPIPEDDGACAHLPGMAFPSIALISTDSLKIDVSKLHDPVVLYCYPRTGLPDKDPPTGWNQIPGARGCTPQCLGYRESYDIFKKLGIQVFGFSVQSTEYQMEAANRLNLPFPLLSDSEFQVTNQLNLPTFEIASMRVIKRLTMLILNGKIIKVFYPIFPPDKDAETVLKWVNEHAQILKLDIEDTP
jgi:peroxiredoxin